MSRVLDLRQPIQALKPEIKHGKKFRIAITLPWRKRPPKINKPLSLAVVGLIVLGIALPIINAALTRARYELKPQARELLGSASQKLASKVTYNKEEKKYQFNALAKKEAAAEPSKSVGTDDASKLYSADFYEDSSKGVTIYDNVNNLTVGFTPLYKTLAPKQELNHFIYPAEGSQHQLVYSARANGLKEDVIVPHYVSDTLDLAYRLTLNSDLESRLNNDGSLGVYSADPTLFGNISFGSDADREKVEGARKNGKKTNLVFSIPAPIIKQSGKGSGNPTAKFELTGNILAIKATGLKDASYPLSIDPTIIVTSSSDFRKGNNEGGIDFDDTNNTIKRGGLTGGTLGTWTTDNSTGRGGQGATMVAYNGFMYSLRNTNNILYAPIASDGSISGSGAMTDSGIAPPSGFAQGHPVTVYNGYMYTAAAEGNAANNIQYAKINADGSLNAFVASGNTFSQVRGHMPLTAYNGYLYITGGYYQTCTITCTDHYLDDTQYAKIKADGSIEPWATTGGTLTTARQDHAVAIYNGYYYVFGGNAGSTPITSVQYARVGNDGLLGSWSTGSSIAATGNGLAVGFAVNGYLYIVPGQLGSSATQYAPIYADGSLGTWSSTTAYTTVRNGPAAVAYNGYIYIGGGDNGSALTDIQYAKIDPAGSTSQYIATTDFDTTNRCRYEAEVYNGYIYVIGGNNCNATFLNTVRYAAINTDGTLGAWAGTSSFTNGRYVHSTAVYNGYIYILGGYGTCGILGAEDDCSDVQYAAINANGTLGTWQTDINSPLLQSRRDGVGWAYNGYLYIAAGQNGPGANFTDIDYVPINSAGDVGAWVNNPTSFGTGVLDAAAVIAGGFVYVTGGCTGSSCSTVYNTVQYGRFDSDGTIDNIANTSTQFTNGRTDHTAWTYNGRLYIAGGAGSGSSTHFSDVQSAQIQANGDLGAWTTTQSLSTTRKSLCAVVYNGIVYILGGHIAGGSVYLDTKYAYLNNGGSGSISSYTSVTSMSTARTRHAATYYKGYIYTAGGIASDGFTLINSIEYAPVNDNGTLGTWQTTTALPSATCCNGMVAYNDRLYVTRTGANAGVRYIDILSNGALGNTWSSGPNMNDAAGHSLGGIAFYNGYIYAIGGDSGGANTVEYTHINADGTLDAWTTTTSINTGRAGLSAIAHNGYLYAMGGCTNIGSEANCSATIKNDVQFAKLNSNGSLASDSGCGAVWCFAPNSSGRNEFGLVAAHGYMYAFRPGVGAAIAERAAILSNGNLGIWERTTVNASPRPAAIYAKGSIYLVAGGGISIATNERANLQSISRRGTYSRMFDMDTDVLPTKFLANGSLNSDTKSIVRLDYKLTPTGSSTFGSATTTESYSLDSLISLVASERRYAQATLTLDDGASSIFPDSATTPTTISDLMLFYRPAPAKRLRGGKTFTGEKERGLDAQP